MTRAQSLPIDSERSERQTVLADLRARYPNARFLALGQTVWWDEPMKAALRRILDESGLGGEMVLGVHDTDYFAKAQVRQPGHTRFELMPHNDGSTKDLWSAAGEISRLFGNECFPTRQALHHHGVPLERLARAAMKERLEFVNEATEAWGWRGLVYTGSRDLIVYRLPLQEVGDAIERMLEYGFQGTLETIADQCCREEARRVAERLLGWVRDFRRDNSDANLTDLYQHVFPRLFELLLGEPPSRTGVCCTSHLLRFTPETAGLPRFEMVDLFLNERTARVARDAYNEAVSGTEIYALDRFGLGALPFDLVIPQHGRGTLRVTLRAIHVETRQPLRIPLSKPVHSVHELAETLHRELGDDVILVGKAVALISMLAREFIFVFNEEGSAYVRHTRRMHDILRARGVSVFMHPILRLRFQTWDALEVGQSSLRLPEHLAQMFGQAEISSAEFAGTWRERLSEQEQLLTELKERRSPRALMALLAERERGDWPSFLERYDSAKARLREMWKSARAVQDHVDSLYTELRQTKREIVREEKARGDHFRSVSEWTPEETARREEYARRIQELLRRRRALLAEISDLKARRLKMERSGPALAARAEISAVLDAAEMARLRLVRNALLVVEGLPHTQHRPSAWWLPMVDPRNHWFQRIVETTELYTEPLVTE